MNILDINREIKDKYLPLMFIKQFKILARALPSREPSHFGSWLIESLGGARCSFFFFLSPSLGRSDILRDNYLATGHEYNTDGTPRRLTVKPALSLLAVNSCHSPPLPPSYVISRGCIIHMQQHLLRREYIHCLSHTVPQASGVADGRASLMVRTASRHYSNAFITAIKKFTRGGGGTQIVVVLLLSSQTSIWPSQSWVWRDNKDKLSGISIKIWAVCLARQQVGRLTSLSAASCTYLVNKRGGFLSAVFHF